MKRYLERVSWKVLDKHRPIVREMSRGRPADGRQRVRQARAGPLLDRLQQWLQATLTAVSAKSELAGAIGYALKRWPALSRYRDDGAVEIDNNATQQPRAARLRCCRARTPSLPAPTPAASGRRC